MWNLERRYWWTYLQGSSQNADMQNRLVDRVGEGKGGRNWETSVEIHTLPYGEQSCCCLVTQSLNHVWLFVTPWTTAHQASLSITNSWSLLKLMSIKSVTPSNHLILCHPRLLPLSIFLSIKAFLNESALCIRWPKYWSFSFSISPNEYSGLIYFRMDWLDLLTVQGTLKSLLKHHSSKASILWYSAVFIVQLSHPDRKSVV